MSEPVQKRAPIDWNSDDVQCVFIPKVCCQSCRGNLVPVRSVAREYGNQERRYYCPACDIPLKVIVDPSLPLNGSDEDDPC